MTKTKKMGQKSFNIGKNLSFWIPVKRNKINITPKPKSKTVATFHEAIKATLLVGQLFSLIPVAGVLSNNPSNVKFVRFSWRSIYACLSMFGQIYMTFMCLYNASHSEASLNATSTIMFYGTTLITMVMFYQMGRQWPNLVHQISRTEQLDPNFDTRLLIRCNVTCSIVLIIALFEHILSLISAFSEAMVCYPNKSLYEGFVTHSYPWVFNFLPYSPLLGSVTQFFHFQSTFVWNFSDLFVICISYYLTSRLDNVNKKLLAAQGKYLPEAFWRTSREDYCRVTQLVRRIDDVISGVIFISFANNLFFICLQLFNTLEDGIKGTGVCSSRGQGASKTHILGGYEAAIYFLFSLVFLISRSVAVSLIASQINSASNVPAPVLYDVPSPVYCVEVQRYLDQVNGDNVALSGLQFFSVTRGLLLTVAGTIVTYELVMVQFNSSGSSSSKVNVTTTMATPMITAA